MIAEIRRNIADPQLPVGVAVLGKVMLWGRRSVPVQGFKTLVGLKEVFVINGRMEVQTAQEIAVGHGIPGVKFQCPSVLDNGFIGSPLLLKDNAKIIMGYGRIGAEFDCFAVLLNCIIHERLGIESVAQFHQR